MADEAVTKDVETLLGAPKRAIRKMAMPLIMAMFCSSINGLVNAAWISGLGLDALAAMAYLFPLFFITVGISNGISVGASAAIARYIGAGDKNNAERTASVAFTLTVITAIVFSVIMIFVARPLMLAIGATDVIDYCMQYINVMFVFAIAFFINALMSSILRSEGSAKRSMIIMIFGSLLNLILDPIFIYGFGWGMAGAALATAVALTVATLPAIYWFFVRKDTYIRLRIGKPHFDLAASKDIYRVGIPASFEFMAISIAVIMMNVILNNNSGDTAVAIYSAGWRIFNLIMIPCIGIGAAIVPVCAAAHGGKDYQKVKAAFFYSAKLAVITMLILAVALFILADIAAVIFTYSDDMAGLHDDISLFIRISCSFLPFLGFGILSSSLFQSLGMGTRSLASTVFRNFVLIPVAFVVGISGTLVDIWWYVAAMEIIGPTVVIIWCILVLNKVAKRSAAQPPVTT
ncbi:MAG: MATE family efflux transporter [Methanomassiliicoccaceae archaeon]|nr:MATE family efflux transporter [Methanomassiliicoccaceae archaeon]